jgi:hypothetical protein
MFRFMFSPCACDQSRWQEKAENLLGWTQHTPAETVVDAASSMVDAGLSKGPMARPSR